MTENDYLVELARLGFRKTHWATAMAECWEHEDGRRVWITITAHLDPASRKASLQSLWRWLGIGFDRK